MIYFSPHLEPEKNEVAVLLTQQNEPMSFEGLVSREQAGGLLTGVG